MSTISQPEGQTKLLVPKVLSEVTEEQFARGEAKGNVVLVEAEEQPLVSPRVNLPIDKLLFIEG